MGAVHYGAMNECPRHAGSVKDVTVWCGHYDGRNAEVWWQSTGTFLPMAATYAEQRWPVEWNWLGGGPGRYTRDEAVAICEAYLLA